MGLKINNFKSLLRNWLPPVLVNPVRRLYNGSSTGKELTWSGPFRNWSEARAHSTGYDDPAILEKCKNALLKVKLGEAVYERDSVLFDKKQYSFAVIAALQKAAIENDGHLCVLDFGGSLGSSYFQNREILGPLKRLQWCIVEQPHFVSCGKTYFEGEELRFYPTIESCLAQQQPNVLLLSGVLQCLEEPASWIEKFCALRIPYIIVDRTSFAETEQDCLMVEHVSETIYAASFPTWFFNKEQWLSQFTGYQLIAGVDSFCDGNTLLNGRMKAWWEGGIWRVGSGE
jgi:putative methyltransferase (TIGR04325 family)